MKRLIVIAALCLAACAASAQTEPIVIKVWPDGPAISNGATPERPATPAQPYDFETTLTVWPAAEPCGIAVLECPGGGYFMLSNTHEGCDFSPWFNERGITYAMLDYRMPNAHHDVPLSDALEAMRIMREHADEWGFDKLGIMGTSAGGHLASTVATHYADAATRPDFQILFYPVITMEEGVTHGGSRFFLLGENAPDDMVALYSNELQVTPATPPAILIHCTDDQAVPVENSLRYYKALVDNGVSAALHIYPRGNHGWGMVENEHFRYRDQWQDELDKWLRQEIASPAAN